VKPSGWLSECRRRFFNNWFFKSTGTATFLVIFFYAYFELLRSPIYPVVKMPLTPLDASVPFWPPAFYLYASLWVYTALVPALQPSFIRLFAYGWGIGAVCVAGLTVFLFFPTAVPFTSADGFTDPSLALLNRLDLAGNACPSLHVATALFSAIAMHRILTEVRAPIWVTRFSWIWCALIIYSTMAIKQHVLIDVVAGLLLGLTFGVVYSKLEDQWLGANNRK
jgi:membrane-associated phospholipid phosphatase